MFRIFPQNELFTQNNDSMPINVLFERIHVNVLTWPSGMPDNFNCFLVLLLCRPFLIR